MIMGDFYDPVITPVVIDGLDIIADVHICLGKHDIRGQIRMMEADKYDMVVFYLIRDMFGLSFPMVGAVRYRGMNYIVVKRFASRILKTADYYPRTKENRDFRFMLGKLIYICKLVGCSFSLKNVEVVDGIPILWRCNGLGYRTTSTINDIDFSYIMGVSKDNLRKGLGNKLAKDIIDDLREVDFDTDILRGYVYLREAEMRFAKGQRKKYPLSRHPRQIAITIEENYGLLLGEYPFNIFK